MNCPKCGVTMNEVEVKSIQLDHCPQCAGTWYDQGELRLLEEKGSHREYRWVDLELWREPAKLRVARESACRCPRDGAALATLSYAGSDVIVEVCPTCYGIWLERGQSDRILEYLEGEADAETIPDLLADVKEEFKELFTRDEPVAKELSDLGKILYLLQLRFAVEHPGLMKLKEAIRHLVPE